MTKYILFLTVVMVFFSCGDEEVTQVERLDFSYEFTIDGQPITLGETYTLNGSTVMFEVANYYIHGMRLANDEAGVIIANEASHLLAGVDQEASAMITDLSPTSVSKARIIIGVDEKLNAQSETDFTERAADDPLGLKDPAMHWNWNSGYKFIRFDGEVDTDGDGIVDTPIAYHIGSNPFSKTLELDTDITLDSGTNALNFSFDLNQFFSTVDFQLEVNWDTHTGNNLELAQLLLANLDNAISLSK